MATDIDNADVSSSKQANILSDDTNMHLESRNMPQQRQVIIERVFAMIHIIDWTSFYLAIIYKTNPSPVDNIKNLKSLMNNEK